MYQIIKFAPSLKFKELPLPNDILETISECIYRISIYVKNDRNSYFRIRDLETNQFVSWCFEGGDFQ